MKLFTLVSCASALALASTLTAVNAYAVAIPLSNVAPASAGTPIAASYLSGTITPPSSPGVPAPFSANYFEEAFRSGITSVCPTGGCINFAFAFSNVSKGSDPIQHFTDTSFAGFNIAAGYVSGSNSLDPSGATLVGGVFSFDFANGVLPGQGSDELIIYTNATNYTIGTSSFQDGVTVTIPGLMPTNATPEPSSLILLGTGLAGLAGAARRKIRG